MMMSGGVSFGESGSGGGNGCSMVAGGRSSLGWSTGGEGGVTIVGGCSIGRSVVPGEGGGDGRQNRAM